MKIFVDGKVICDAPDIPARQLIQIFSEQNCISDAGVKISNSK